MLCGFGRYNIFHDQLTARTVRSDLTVDRAFLVTVYESLYVALAEKRDIPMVTADERLIRQLSADAALARRVVWVGDLSV
jgi:predicted nucleic acid-binding protein